MRIWQCTSLDVSRVGGVERHIAEVSAGLRRLGHEVHVGPEAPEAWFSTGELIEPVIVHTHGGFWPNPLRFQKFRKQLKWIHVCHGTSFGRVVACREFLSVSGWRGSVSDFLPTHFADAAVAVGQRALDEARSFFRMNLPATVIANGADPVVFAPLRQIALAPRLIYVGRDGDRVKNVPMMLHALDAVRPLVPGLTLVCAPGIDYDFQVHPFVKNLGALVGAELAQAMAQCRALLLCSLYEGDPLVLHEAMSMGLPVIVSDIPQLRSTLANYPNATYVNPRNADSISFGIKTAIFGLLPAPSLRTRDWLQVAREFADFYPTVTKRKK